MAAMRQGLLAGTVALAMLAGCAPLIRNHGYVPPDQDLAQIMVGETTVDALPLLIGQPSAEGLLSGSAWYYVGSQWRRVGIAPAREVSREVVAVTLTETGTVANVERFGLERGRVVTLSRRVTEGSVTSVSLIRQLLGNLGRFSADQFIE